LSAAKATGAGEKKIGLEVYDHSQLLRLRYSVSLFNENGGSLSGNLVSSLLSGAIYRRRIFSTTRYSRGSAEAHLYLFSMFQPRRLTGVISGARKMPG
jgi:hypothetical protein